jgi:hypothetical protein
MQLSILLNYFFYLQNNENRREKETPAYFEDIISGRVRRPNIFSSMYHYPTNLLFSIIIGTSIQTTSIVPVQDLEVLSQQT